MRYLDWLEELIRKFRYRRGLMLAGFLAVVVLGCKQPNVDPNVDPDDKGAITFVILDDIEQRTPENHAVIGDNTLWQQLIADGLERRILNVANPAAKPYVERANDKKISIPALFVVNGSGKFLVSEKLGDAKRVKELAKKYTPKSARGPPAYFDPSTGQTYRLGMIPADAEALQKRAKMVPFLTGLKARGASLIPRDQWKEVQYPQFHDPKWVLNQQNTNGCVGFSCAAANMKLRHIHGHLFERFSGNFSYAGINGGRDAGAMILDSQIFSQKYGFCREDEFPMPGIYWRQVPEKAKESGLTRQLVLSYPIDTEEEMATALQLGMIVQAGVQVDGNFSSFDANGVSRANGRYANHSIHIYGMKQVAGEWVYYMGNTWGSKWGPWQNGSCFLRAKGIVLRGDAFVHADSEWSPSDLPTPKRDIQPLSVTPLTGDSSRFILAH